MSLTVSQKILLETTSAELDDDRAYAESRSFDDSEYTIEVDTFTEEALEDLLAAAEKAGDSKVVRAIETVLNARSGIFDSILPNFKAFEGVLSAYLKHDLIDGWIYVQGHDGKLYPHLVTHISFDDGISYSGRRSKAPPATRIHTIYYGISRGSNNHERHGIMTESFSFSPQDVARRRIADILTERGIYKETPGLKEDYEAQLARFHAEIRDHFSEQFRLNGSAYYYERDDYHRRGTVIRNRKVIHDMAADEYGAQMRYTDSPLLEEALGTPGGCAVPEHPVIKVFDLETHENYWVHSDNVTPYVYDKSLRAKLVLPESHRDLLDVLTSDLSAFTEDIIEGKSAGNVVLCKGVAGIGKTLTAEVYAELIERPLYKISSGRLGTTVSKIEDNLKQIFQRAKRWNCVLLLDECDVFVVERGDNIEQNAIVAEFLRTLEYFDGLMFMTTNRPHDIDDAIISRCAAIIDYKVPGGEHTKLIWKVMSDQFEANLTEEMIDTLVDLFPSITPRDIKHLLRLVLRVVNAGKGDLSADTFRRCAMFRAIEIKSDAVAA
jgi:hypothetical protein